MVATTETDTAPEPEPLGLLTALGAAGRHFGQAWRPLLLLAASGMVLPDLVGELVLARVSATASASLQATVVAKVEGTATTGLFDQLLVLVQPVMGTTLVTYSLIWLLALVALYAMYAICLAVARGQPVPTAPSAIHSTWRRAITSGLVLSIILALILIMTTVLASVLQLLFLAVFVFLAIALLTPAEQLGHGISVWPALHRTATLTTARDGRYRPWSVLLTAVSYTIVLVAAIEALIPGVGLIASLSYTDPTASTIAGLPFTAYYAVARLLTGAVETVILAFTPAFFATVWSLARTPQKISASA